MTRRAVIWLALAFVLLTARATASADAPAAAGWWWIAYATEPSPPPPPSVPTGGLYVAEGITGTEAVAALRFAIGQDVRPAALSLTIADAVGAPTLALCPVTSPWQPGAPGPWASRPEYDCEAAIPGELSADQTTVTFSLSRFPHADDVDVALVPASEAGADGSVFQVAFDAPDADAFTTSTNDTGAAAAPMPDESAPTASTAGGEASPTGSGGQVSPLAELPANSIPSVTDLGGSFPATVGEPGAGGGPAGTSQQRGAPSEPDGRGRDDADHRDRVILVTLCTGIVGLHLHLRRRSGGEPVVTHPAPVMGGIGSFRRLRVRSSRRF